jgi:hypothetical protein
MGERSGVLSDFVGLASRGLSLLARMVLVSTLVTVIIIIIIIKTIYYSVQAGVIILLLLLCTVYCLMY